MAKVLEALIAKGRRVRRPREQKEVAFGLADLSTHEELHDRIVRKGAIRSLLELLKRSQDAEAQRFSALCIANCASAVFTRLRIVEDGVLEPMIGFIKDDDADMIVRQYSAMGLGNLAAEPDNHDEIVKLDAIPALVTLLKASDVESGRYAAFALSNLAANANLREDVVLSGAVPALVALACCEDFNVQRQSLSCIRGLCITPGYRVQVVRDGFLDPLVLMARTDDMSLLREVAAAFNCLSCMEENKMEIVDRAIANIISMIMCGDPEVGRTCTYVSYVRIQQLSRVGPALGCCIRTVSLRMLLVLSEMLAPGLVGRVTTVRVRRTVHVRKFVEPKHIACKAESTNSVGRVEHFLKLLKNMSAVSSTY